MAAYLVLVERKFLARLQIRYGPNRAGKFGLLQPIADTIKMMAKEDTVPEAAERTIFLLAPAVVAFTALLMFAVVPFGSDMMLGGKKIPLVISISMWGCCSFLQCPLLVFTVLPWAAGPRIQNTAFWAVSAARPR